MMHKHRFRVSDAIPEMPYSFEQAVSRTLESVCAGSKQAAGSRAASAPERPSTDTQSRREKNRNQRLSKILLYAATAAMFVAVFALGSVVVRNALHPNGIDPFSSVQTETPAEQVYAPTAENVGVTIRLLPELEEAEAYAAAREQAQQPPFSEEDWGWIRKIEVSLHDLEITEGSLRWLTTFRIPPEYQPAQWDENPFAMTEMTGMDLFADSIRVKQNGRELFAEETPDYTCVTDPYDGAWAVTCLCSVQLTGLKANGTAEVWQQFRLLDNKVDWQANIATVALIEQTFTIDTAWLSVTPKPDEPNALVPAIRWNGTLYAKYGESPLAGEIDESAIAGYVTAVVPQSQFPTEDGQANFGEVGTPYALTDTGLVVRYNNEWHLFEPIEAPAAVTPVPETPTALVPAIRYNMLLYTMSDVEYAGEIDESAITGRVSSVVPLSEWPQMHGQANFGKIGMPYAETENGLVVLFANEWRLMEPVMPDPAAGVIDAACAQVLAERKEIDERYRHTDTMTEEEIGDLDAEANFNHQRLVKLMSLWTKAVSVEQKDGAMRLSEIAYVNGSVTFAFAASLDTPFDDAPVIKLNGFSSATNDKTAFINLKPTETEHYAFYEIRPGQLSGVRVITVENAGHVFCFRYDADQQGVTLPKDDAEFAAWFGSFEDPDLSPTEEPCTETPVPHPSSEPAQLIPSVRYNGTVYRLTDEPYEGEIVQLLDTVSGIDSNPVPGRDGYANFGEAGMVLGLSRKGPVIDLGGWKLLRPDTSGIRLDEPDALVPAIRYQGILYLLAASVDGNALSQEDEYVIDAITSAVPPTEWPMEEGQINFGALGEPVAKTKDGLLIRCFGKQRLFLPTLHIPAVFRVNGDYVVPFWNFLSSPEGDGQPIAQVLEMQDDLYAYIPFVEYRGQTIDVVPRGWALERVYLLNAQNKQIAALSANELALQKDGYEIPDSFLNGLASGVYTLSAVVTQGDGAAVTSYECVIRLSVN